MLAKVQRGLLGRLCSGLEMDTEPQFGDFQYRAEERQKKFLYSLSFFFFYKFVLGV